MLKTGCSGFSGWLGLVIISGSCLLEVGSECTVVLGIEGLGLSGWLLVLIMPEGWLFEVGSECSVVLGTLVLGLSGSL